MDWGSTHEGLASLEGSKGLHDGGAQVLDLHRHEQLHAVKHRRYLCSCNQASCRRTQNERTGHIREGELEARREGRAQDREEGRVPVPPALH